MQATDLSVTDLIRQAAGPSLLAIQPTVDHIPTFWISKEKIQTVLRQMKEEIDRPYKMLYDLTAIDERVRLHREGQPDSDFTVVYHLYSFDRNAYLRFKVPLKEKQLFLPTITPLWRSADWYEREAWDLFGVRFEGHPHLVRILMPRTWEGHPLRKDHPSHGTELGLNMPDPKMIEEQEQLQFRPEEWGLKRQSDGTDFIFLNLGPHHPGTHGVLRVVLQLDGEIILDAVPDIGFHHRGQEKIAERQTWHTYLPYTDRVDYLSGVINNLAYLMGVERLAGIEIPPRAQVIRVMMSELYRITNHLVWLGTFAQDVGQLSPVFYAFNDRERAYAITEAVCGARMHPNWFRMGGTAQDLPIGWEPLFRDFLKYLPSRLDEYEGEILKNRIFKGRTKGIGQTTVDEAIEWGMTGPNLRACGLAWDFRKAHPYSGYDRFEFDIPVGKNGDAYDRAAVRIEEMRQSLRIIDQCVRRMPDGPYKAIHPLATPPPKARTMHDIETLIAHFLNVSWGPVIPPGEALGAIEASKGNNGYYLISDGSTTSYRTRIRTPSFPHMQMLPLLCRGRTISDLIAIFGSVDFVLSDVDR
ncbi:MAG: NADH-quinone oxidoreductase subunit C/D [Candidatus Manganitrophaceae bacterium]|nr:MAG: NADH-quinone oxidoreductase subunit C/D [Candidatus Manganitrophaceae bacterium]